MVENDNRKQGSAKVRVVELLPMRVISFHAISEQPENDSLEKLIKWKQDNNKESIKNRRFGFNNPNPEEGKSEYGYEIWEVIDEDETETGDGVIKQFGGGLYAVTSIKTDNPASDILKGWQNLHSWVLDSKYIQGEHQWMEEHIEFNDKFIKLDLLLPIEVKG